MLCSHKSHVIVSIVMIMLCLFLGEAPDSERDSDSDFVSALVYFSKRHSQLAYRRTFANITLNYCNISNNVMHNAITVWPMCMHLKLTHLL